MTGVWIGLLPIIVVVLFAVVALVFLMVRRMSSRNILIVVLLVVLLPLGAIFFLRVSTPHAVVGTSTATMRMNFNDQVSTSTWMSAINDGAPSPHVSTRTLAPHISNQVIRILESVVSTSGVRVIGDDVGPTLRREVKERIGAAKFPMIEADGTDDVRPAERPKNETWVTLRWKNRTEGKAPWWPTPLVQATLVAEIDGPLGTGGPEAELVEKPWLDAAPTVVGGRLYVVAKSPEPAATEAEARHLAQVVAVDRLVPLVRSRAAQLGNRTNSVPDSVIRDYAFKAVLARRHMVDDCVVRIDRTYGPVYFAAEMIDMGTPMVDAVASDAVNSVTRDRRSIASMIGAIAGMVLVLAAVYGLLNALTRGYFRGTLRAAVLIAVVVAAVAILLLLA